MSSFISGIKNLARRFSPTLPLRSNSASSTPSDSPMVIIEEINDEQEITIVAVNQGVTSIPQYEGQQKQEEDCMNTQPDEINIEMGPNPVHATTQEEVDEVTRHAEQRRNEEPVVEVSSSASPPVNAQREEVIPPPKRRSQRSVGSSEARQEKPKTKKKKRKPRVPEATGSSGLFETATAHQRYNGYLCRQFINERGESDIKDLHEVRELLDGTHMLSSVEDVRPYDKELVCEFWAHLPAVKTEEEPV
ncbi:unnamed protein product [Cochlearia groenlandica]